MKTLKFYTSDVRIEFEYDDAEYGFGRLTMTGKAEPRCGPAPSMNALLDRFQMRSLCNALREELGEKPEIQP